MNPTPEERAEKLIQTEGLIFSHHMVMRWNISIVRQAFRECETDACAAERERLQPLLAEVKRLREKAKTSPGGATLNLGPLYKAIDALDIQPGPPSAKPQPPQIEGADGKGVPMPQVWTPPIVDVMPRIETPPIEDVMPRRETPE